MIKLITSGAVFLGLVFTQPNVAAADAYMRVADVGGAWCVVARTPDGHTFVYDSSDWPGARTASCIDAVREIALEGVIDLLVVSRQEGRPLGDLPEILRDFHVRSVLHNRADLSPMLAGSAEREWLVGDEALAPGTSFDLGDARVVYVAGWRDGADARRADETRLSSYAEDQLATVTVRFVYEEHAVLISRASLGSTRSRLVCRYDQREMVDNAAAVPLRSDIMAIGYLGLSDCLRDAVAASAVVIGTDWRRGRSIYDYGVSRDRLFSTAFVDCPAGSAMDETQGPCTDRPGDDDVEIWLPQTGQVRIDYRNPHALRR